MNDRVISQMVQPSASDRDGKFRVAVLNTHPIQYFAPLYAHLNGAPQLEVTALYLSDFSVRGGHDRGFGQAVTWDLGLLDGYPHKFVGKSARHWTPDSGFFSIFGADLWRELRSGNYDALWLHGHAYAANLVALAAARSINLPVLMRSETHLGLKRHIVKKTMRKATLGLLYRQCARFLAIGSANKAFYKSLGIDDANVFLVPYAVDNARFMERSRMTVDERRAARAGLGVNDDLPVVLYAAKFQSHKRPDDLVAACARLHREGLRFHLVMAGSGSLEAQLRKQAQSQQLPRCHFPGFVNQSAIPRLYGAADVFVLPSEQEPWGLVVNEAMCAGLPVVATTAVGSVPDLVLNGDNGATYQAGDIEGLANALSPIIASAPLRQSMSRRSQEIIRTWDYEACRNGLLAAISGLPRRRTSVAQDGQRMVPGR